MQQHSTKYFACIHPPPLGPGDGVIRSKFYFFQNMVMLHVKFKNMVANILPEDPHTPPPPHPPVLGMRSIGQNSTFSEHGHVAYQIKRNHEI